MPSCWDFRQRADSTFCPREGQRNEGADKQAEVEDDAVEAGRGRGLASEKEITGVDDGVNQDEPRQTDAPKAEAGEGHPGQKNGRPGSQPLGLKMVNREKKGADENRSKD